MYDSCIRFHARTRPHAAAFVTVEREVSYREFDRDIDRVAGALAEAGLSGARLAALDAVNPYLHYLLLLALMRLGVGSVSLTKAFADHVADTLAPDALITDDADRAGSWRVGRVVHASTAWVAGALSRPPAALPPAALPPASLPPAPLPPARPDPDALGRVLLSSGTTGRPKTILRSWRHIDALVSHRLCINSAWKPARSERLLSLFGLDTGLLFLVLANWAAGGALVTADEEPFRREALFHKLAPTTLAGSPAQLQLILSWLPADFMPRPDLTILASGSHLPPSLSQALQARLTPMVWNTYGSSEAGMVAAAQAAQIGDDPAATGWIVPNVEVEVVDDDGEVLPFGEQGAIRLRTPSLADGYYGEEEVTARHFKGGWFYPGDIGSVSAEGWLRVEGRGGDVMNFGGVKVLPHTLEAAVLACPGVKDVAAFAAPNRAGLPAPWLAIVRGEGFDETRVAVALKGMLLPPVQMAWISEIPRNERGKVLRERLRAAVQRAAQPGADAP